MKKTIVLFAVGLLGLGTARLNAQTYNDLYNFGSNPNDPIGPSHPGIIAQGRDGNLYSTSWAGGADGYGAVFRVTPKGTLAVIYSFDSVHGDAPYSGLTLGAQGDFYGAAYQGSEYSYGNVFSIGATGGQPTILHSFAGTDGAYPFGPPVLGPDGNLYGTTSEGGANDYGTIYQIILKTGKFNLLHSFDFTDGSYPVAPLVLGTDGNLYGSAQQGGILDCNSGCGTIFKISTAGKFDKVHSFVSTDGAYPLAPLVEGNNGSFYGTAYAGGDVESECSDGCGTVFQLTSAGEVTVLHAFQGQSGSDGAYPYAGLVQGSDGNFYGVTYAGGAAADGTIFEVNPSGSKYSVIYQFAQSTGFYSQVTLTQNTSGSFYGDTYEGGSEGDGVFYSLKVKSAGAFVSLVPTTAKPGNRVVILGQGLTGTTAVSFNGSAAQFTVNSATYLTATVPSGATSGFVTVTTPAGKLTSNRQFQVQ